MGLFERLDFFINYSNNYSLSRTFVFLESELNKAIKNKNLIYSKEIVYSVFKIQDKFKTILSSLDKPSTAQTIMAQKIRRFASYLEYKFKKAAGKNQ